MYYDAWNLSIAKSIILAFLCKDTFVPSENNTIDDSLVGVPSVEIGTGTNVSLMS